MIPHLCLCPCLHYWEWPQASWTDQHKESGRYTSSSTENAALTPKLWCPHQVLSWQRDVGCRYLLLLCTLKTSEVPLDINISHVHSTPYRITEVQALIQDDPLLCSLAETIIAGWPDNINDVPCALCPYHGHRNILNSWRWPHPFRWSSHYSSIRKGEDPPSKYRRTHGNQQAPKQRQTLCVLARNQLRHQMSHWIMPNMPISPPTGTMTATPTNTGPRMPMATPWHWLLPLRWIWIPSCHRLLLQDAHHQKNPCILNAMPPRLSQSWRNSLQNMASQRYSILTTAPGLPNHASPSFATDWQFNHNTCSPRNPRSNGQAEAAIKTIKVLLTHMKCSGQDPYLALLAYHSMPINAHLSSPAEMLYHWVLCTTIPQQIRHTDPHANAEHDHLNQHAAQSAEYHNQWGCHKKPPFFASQTVSVLNDDRNLWLPSTIICKANNGSYLVQVIGGGQYRCDCDHIWEHHLDAVKPDTSNISNVAPAAFTSAPTTANSCCTHNTNTSCTSSYTAKSMQSSTCSMFTTMNTDIIPLDPHHAKLAHPLLSYANQLKTGNHHPDFLKRYRPRLSLTDEPDDAMTWDTPSTTNEVLYP